MAPGHRHTLSHGIVPGRVGRDTELWWVLTWEQSLDNPLTTTPPLVETCAPSQPGCTPIYRADFWGSLDPSSPVPFGEGLRLSGEGLRAEHTLQAREHSSGKAHWEGRATVRRNLPLTAQAVPGHMLHPQELAQG